MEKKGIKEKFQDRLTKGTEFVHLRKIKNSRVGKKDDETVLIIS